MAWLVGQSCLRRKRYLGKSLVDQPMGVCMKCEDTTLHINVHQRSCTLDEVLNNQVGIKTFFFFLRLTSFISHPNSKIMGTCTKESWW